MFYVYIIQSLKNGTYYIGQTNDLNKRLFKHNNNQSKFTKNKGPWVLKYFSIHHSRIDALREEKRIKSKKSKKYIDYLINSSGQMHPVSDGT